MTAQRPNFTKMAQALHAVADLTDLFPNLPRNQLDFQLNFRVTQQLQRFWDRGQRFLADLQLLARLLLADAQEIGLRPVAVNGQVQTVSDCNNQLSPHPSDAPLNGTINTMAAEVHDFRTFAQNLRAVANEISLIPDLPYLIQWLEIRQAAKRVWSNCGALGVDLKLLALFVPPWTQMMEIRPEVVDGQVQTSNEHHDQLSLRSSDTSPSELALNKHLPDPDRVPRSGNGH